MNFFLEKKLTKWKDAGVLEKETLDRIIDYEENDNSSYVLNSILGLGALSILVGVISVIAANWFVIPAYLKLLSNFSWLCLLVFGVYYFDKNKKDFLREAALFLLFGSILGSISLIGQIYHLSSHPFKALIFWLAIGTPLALFARSKYLSYFWATSIAVLFFQLISFVRAEFSFINYLQYLGFLPLLFFYLAELFSRTRKIDNYKEACLSAGWFSFAVCISILGSIRWADKVNDSVSPWVSVIILVLTIPAALIYAKRSLLQIGVLIFGGMLFLEVPQTFSHESLKIFGGVLFILLYSLVAYTGIKIKFKKLFDYSCLVIAIRIIIIYFEVFGSLLQTGVGLIVSGSLILGVTLLWIKKRDLIWNMGKINE